MQAPLAATWKSRLDLECWADLSIFAVVLGLEARVGLSPFAQEPVHRLEAVPSPSTVVHRLWVMADLCHCLVASRLIYMRVEGLLLYLPVRPLGLEAR
jgi:hypothetical protein